MGDSHLHHDISPRPILGEGEGVRAKFVTHFYEARQWNSPAQRVCIIAPRNTIHTSVIGMKTFQPRRMI